MFLCYNRRFHDKDCAVTVPGCFTGLKGKCTKMYEQVYFDGVAHLARYKRYKLVLKFLLSQMF